MKNMMLALTTCLALAACAAPLAVNYDYDTSANFAALKSFDWMPASGNAAGDELLVKKIKNTVDTQLQAKGRSPNPGSPDFLIAMQLSGKTTYGGSTGMGVSVGIPVGQRGSISVGGGKSKAHEKTEGTLVLDFVDARSKALLWRATASGAVEPGMSPEEQQARINDVISQMLAHFPPEKK